MKTKNIFNRLAMVMLLPAMLLTTACSNDDDAVNNDNTAKKGYPLQVTINVTRQGDEGTTRATFNPGNNKLEFSAGDKLFVEGYDNTVGSFAGTLDMVSAGTFSGTIYTQNPYSGTADALLAGANRAEACLLPNGYTTYDYLHITNPGTYSANDGYTANNAFATTKATAVEQFSREIATSYSSGFALTPQNAILNFTIAGLTASTSVDVELTGPGSLNITRSVTTDGSGNATFAVGVEGGTDFNTLSLTVGGNAITLASGSKTLEAGHIYNVKRTLGALLGKFTISNNGGMYTRQVAFSQGNLQATYNGSAWSWTFAEHQYDYIGNASGNTSINGNGTVSDDGTVDLFGWVGESSTWTGVAQYGISNSTTTNTINGYGTDGSENLKSDWGNTMGTGWFTLKTNEWGYLFKSRTTGGTVGSISHARYTMATIRTDVNSGIDGVILFPDGVDITNTTDYFTTLGKVNNPSAYATKCTSAQWIALENKGCVFLPAAGYREGNSVSYAGSYGYYWSSSSNNESNSYRERFYSSNLDTPFYILSRNTGCSVRLVRVVE